MTKNAPSLLAGIDTIGAQPLADRRRELFARALFEGMENSLPTSKSKSTVSLHTSQLHQKCRTWEENSLPTSRLAKSTVSPHEKQPHQKSRRMPQEKASKEMLSPKGWPG